jgi:signal peptidase
LPSASSIWTPCAAWLLVVCSLVVWSLIPMAWGWQPAVVMTGSMMPVISPGDVVVVAPGQVPERGQIVLVRDAEVPTGRVAHRVVAIAADGTLTTKGDANPTPDSVCHRASEVIGVARLVVPRAGRLALLRARPTRDDLLWAVVTAIAAVGFAATYRARPSRP